MSKIYARDGFTLIDIMVAIAVFSIIAAGAMPALINVADSMKLVRGSATSTRKCRPRASWRCRRTVRCASDSTARQPVSTADGADWLHSGAGPERHGLQSVQRHEVEVPRERQRPDEPSESRWAAAAAPQQGDIRDYRNPRVLARWHGAQTGQRRKPLERR